MGVELLTDLPEGLPDRAVAEKRLIAFAVIPVRDDEIPAQVHEPFVVVQAVQHRVYVAVADDRDGEEQAAPRIEIDHVLSAIGAGKAPIKPTGKRGALDGVAVDGEQPDGHAARFAAKGGQNACSVFTVGF